MAAYLLILGDRAGLAWVLTHQQMAFRGGAQSSGADALNAGDELLIYTTRGCFNNPTRDVGRVAGLAVVAEETRTLDRPVAIGRREFSRACRFELRSLAPRGTGVALNEQVDSLEVFPDPASWSAWLRRPLLALPTADANRLKLLLAPLAVAPGDVIDTYR